MQKKYAVQGGEVYEIPSIDIGQNVTPHQVQEQKTTTVMIQFPGLGSHHYCS